MKRITTVLLALFACCPPVVVAAGVPGHCMPYQVSPVPGDPGAFRVQTARGSIVARRAAPSAPLATTAVAEFRVFPNSFDADGDTLGTVHDTILVEPGTLVRWVRAGPGFHTVTNGADSGDPTAATEFSAIFDEFTNSFEWTFTAAGKHDFFCFIHEPVMEGTVIVTSATTDAPAPGVIRAPTFTRSPAPNPTRGPLSFAIALPRATRVLLTVHDVAGRTVATLQDAPLAAGEHPFRWDGRGADGRSVRSGRYFVRLSAGAVRQTRAVSLLR